MTFLVATLTQLRRVPAWVWVAFLLLGAGWYYGHTRYNAGRVDVQAKWDKATERGKVEVARLKSEAGKVTVRVETKYIDRVKTIREKGETIVQKVPVYISRDLPELPGAWRVLHDAASQGAVPGSAEFTDAAPVAPQDAASTVTANYAICLANAEQLRGLQEWVSEQKRLNP
jgi:hypothetical protein